jgi:hypothetical protein
MRLAALASLPLLLLGNALPLAAQAAPDPEGLPALLPVEQTLPPSADSVGEARSGHSPALAGLTWGILVGGAAGALVGAAMHSPCEVCLFTQSEMALYWGLIGAGTGALVGALIGASRAQTGGKERSPASYRFTPAPGGGVALSISWVP